MEKEGKAGFGWPARQQAGEALCPWSMLHWRFALEDFIISFSMLEFYPEYCLGDLFLTCAVFLLVKEMELLEIVFRLV